MCLAVPGKVLEVSEDRARVEFNGNVAEVCTALTPGVGRGEWVLIHAGFAITTLDERDALDTWKYLRGVSPSEVAEGVGGDGAT